MLQPEKLTLKCWGEGWGLPSIDIDCLSTLMYSYISKAPSQIVPSLPKDTITGVMPEIQVENFVHCRAFSVISLFRKEGYNADFQLSVNENADTFAFLSYINQKLRPAILYTLWLDASNYTKVTRPEYARVCGFPWSLWYPSKIRKSVQNHILQTKGGHLSSMQDMERRLFKEAQICLNMMETKLGSSKFFFGDYPSTLDAILYGHLGVLLQAPLISTEFQQLVISHDKLKNLYHRMEKYLPKKNSFSPVIKELQVQEPLLKKDQVITIAIALLAMVTYAVSSGVLTAKRSKLAQKLETYKDHHQSHTEINEFESVL